MGISRKSATTLLGFIITGLVGIGIGFAAGTVTTVYKIGQASHIRAIRDDLSTLRGLENSPQGFQKVLWLTTRTRLTSAVCYEYAWANSSNKSKIRSYVAEYNMLTNNTKAAPSLPPITDTTDNDKIRSMYCAQKS